MVEHIVKRRFFLTAMLPVLLALLPMVHTSAQDAMFSQVFTAPVYLNPALNGAYDGTFRVAAIYRDQWASLIDDPYRTYTVTGDVKIEFGKQRRTRDFVATGLVFMADKVNPFDYSTNQFLFSGAYHKFLDFDYETYLSVGLSAGMNQKNFIYEDFTFQDQYNGVNGFTLTTDEDLPRNNHAFMDLGLGLNFSSRFSKALSYNAGASIYHITEPNISFYQEEQLPPQSDVINTRVLDSRLSAHLSLSWQSSVFVTLSPAVLYISQGNHQNIRAGTGTRLLLNDVVQNALHMGLWANILHDPGSTSVNSLIVMTGFEYKRLLFGFSYDLSLEDLSNYQLGQHVFEFSVSYIGEYENEGLFCPRF